MSQKYHYRKLELVKGLSLVERLMEAALGSVAYLLGYLPLLTSLIPFGLQRNHREFRVQSTPHEEDGAQVYRRTEAVTTLQSSFHGLNSVKEVFRWSVAKFSNRPCMGARTVIKSTEETEPNADTKRIKNQLSPFRWKTYTEVLDHVVAVASHLRRLGISKGSKVAVFGETRLQWLVMALSIFELDATCITLFPTVSDEFIEYCLNLSKPVAIYVDNGTIDRILKLVERVPSIRIVIFNPTHMPLPTLLNFPTSKDFSFYNFEDFFNDTKIIEHGASSESPPSNTDSVSDEEDLAIIMFTSGTTGMPKGAMITHQNILALLGGVMHDEKYWANITFPAYLPLSHVMEFCAEMAVMAYGGKIGYCNKNTLLAGAPHLAADCLSDLEMLKPDIFVTVPIILDRVKKKILTRMKAMPRLRQIVFQTVYNARAYFFERGYETPLLNRLFFGKTRHLLGGNVRLGLVGGAPLSVETEEFFNICFGIFKQGYGATEACAATTLSNMDYHRPNNTGPPVSCCEIKLESWEEAGYFANDPQHKRGEILVSGRNIVAGYYADPTETANAFRRDEKTGKRWFHTGDIGEILEDGTVRIIDRKRDTIKLTNGEFVSLAHTELIAAKNRYVSFVCAFPDKTYSSLVVVVSVDSTSLPSSLKSSDKSKDEAAGLIEAEVINEFKQVKKVVIPSRVIVTDEVWTPESGFLTPSMKVRRSAVREKYIPLLENS